jgi:hypothetical protein
MKAMYQAIVRQNCGLIRSFLEIGEGPPASYGRPLRRLRDQFACSDVNGQAVDRV